MGGREQLVIIFVLELRLCLVGGCGVYIGLCGTELHNYVVILTCIRYICRVGSSFANNVSLII